MEWAEGEYRISTDKSLLSLGRICEFLSKSYWADKRPRERIELSIQNSVCYGVYHHSQQVGFARVVSDMATIYWVCDVFIDEAHRGKGLGKRLMQCIVESPEFRDLQGLLGTRDAHGLYEQFGFKRDPERLMRRRQVFPHVGSGSLASQ